MPHLADGGVAAPAGPPSPSGTATGRIVRMDPTRIPEWPRTKLRGRLSYGVIQVRSTALAGIAAKGPTRAFGASGAAAQRYTSDVTARVDSVTVRCGEDLRPAHWRVPPGSWPGTGLSYVLLAPGR